MSATTNTLVTQATLAQLAGATYSVPAAAHPSTWSADLTELATEAEAVTTAAADKKPTPPQPLVWPIAVWVQMMGNSMGLTLPATQAELMTEIYAVAAALAAAT